MNQNSSAWAITKAVSSQTIETMARQLAGLHEPLKTNWHGKFGVATQQASRERFRTTQPGFKHSVKEPLVANHPEDDKESSAKEKQDAKVYECMDCGASVDSKVEWFCKFNKVQFQSKIVCRDCQPKYPAVAKSSPTK
jgi:DNA-directed RNA polymerase subunit RPC12/RpoP